jgi:hypothetical protein
MIAGIRGIATTKRAVGPSKGAYGFPPQENLARSVGAQVCGCQMKSGLGVTSC